MRSRSKSRPTSDTPGKWLRVRTRLLGVAFMLMFAIVFARAFKLQVIDRDKLRHMARDQYVRQVNVPARRGDIFDRRGVPLAQSVEVDSLWIDPSMTPDPRAAAKELARKLKLDAGDLLARFEKGKRFAWLKRQATPNEVKQVNALNIPGIGVMKEPRRYYPQRELAAQVIGVVGTDGRGLEGLEHAFNDELTGRGSKLPGYRDAKRRMVLTEGATKPASLEGASITLTLDRHLQYVAEKAVARVVEEFKAVAAMAVVLDPSTGEILVLANLPQFNPNEPSSAPRDNFRNRVVADTFEPGSTFKSFLIAAALEERAIAPTDSFFCENGRWKLGRNVINDTHPYGWLTPTKILQVSSNICSAKIAQVLGRERLVDYYQRFGFGERLNLGLSGEARGVIPFPKAEITLATESYGQGLTASALQLAAGYAALANDGVLMRPYLVQKVVDSDGLILLENKPTQVRQVVSASTSKQVLAMLETVVEKEGTAPKARMEEYRVAGKTGTAQKVDPIAKGYSDKRIASFVGVVPADDPRLVIAIVVDEPKSNVYGGIVAAPAFKEIAAAAMPYLGVPPSKPGVVVSTVAMPKKHSREKTTPLLAAPEAKMVAVISEQVEEGTVQVPNLHGEVGRQAVSRLLGVALEPHLQGSGRVVSQTPPPGAWVEKGARVILELAQHP